MIDSRMRIGDGLLRINEEESMGFKGESRATRNGGEHTDMAAVLEQMQRMNAYFDHIDQRLDRVENSQGGPNPKMVPHGGRGRGGRGHHREEFGGGNFGDDFEEGIDETFAFQERETRGRCGRDEDDDLGNIKVNIPPFMGKSDPEAYLEWEEHI